MSAKGEGSKTTVKVIVLGNGSAGKSSICNRLRADGFQPVYKQTVGIDWHEKKIVVRGREVVLQLHDIGGQSLSSGMIGQYIAGVSVVFLLYDVTDNQSFRDLQDWYDVVAKNLTSAADKRDEPSGPDDDPTPLDEGLKSDGYAGAGVPSAAKPAQLPALIYLLANKVDLQHLRKVSQEANDRFIRDKKLSGGFQVSAKTGESVVTAFYTAAAKAVGVDLTPEELAFTERVLAVAVAGGDDEGTLPGADEIEKADREAEARKRGQQVGCCTVQ